jgi:methyl-accepting chemotaxis protein
MKLQARVSAEAASEETGPKLKLLRSRLLSQESSSEDDSTEVGAREANPVCAPDYGTREVSQGNMTKKTPIEANSEFELSCSVAKVFQPTNASWERGAAELATSLESLERVQQSAAAALEPMKALYEHMRKLPYTFAPLRAFEEQLGVLAQSFEPMKALHEEIAHIVEDSGSPFVQLAKSLEVVSESQQQIARLASTFETAAEIQAEFGKMAQAFNRTSPRTSKTIQNAT